LKSHASTSTGAGTFVDQRAECGLPGSAGSHADAGQSRAELFRLQVLTGRWVRTAGASLDDRRWSCLSYGYQLQDQTGNRCWQRLRVAAETDPCLAFANLDLGKGEPTMRAVGCASSMFGQPATQRSRAMVSSSRNLARSRTRSASILLPGLGSVVEDRSGVDSVGGG
jgi:hypothetical protein